MKAFRYYSLSIVFYLLVAIAGCHSDEGGKPEKLLRVVNLHAVAITDSTVTLQWENRNDNAHVIQIVAEPEQGNPLPVYEVPGNLEEAVYPGLEANTRYTLWVNVVGAGMTGPVHVKTPMPWGRIIWTDELNQNSLVSDDPYYYRYFVEIINPVIAKRLSEDGAEVMNDVGSSARNGFAMDMLQVAFGATLLRTGSETDYESEGSAFDLTVSILGVDLSVNTAFVSSEVSELTPELAGEFLEVKLTEIQEAQELVSLAHKPDKRILFIVVREEAMLETFGIAFYNNVSAELRANTKLIVTLTSGDDASLY